MSIIIQHEWYKEFLSKKLLVRGIERDDIAVDHDEKNNYGEIILFHLKKHLFYNYRALLNANQLFQHAKYALITVKN